MSANGIGERNEVEEVLAALRDLAARTTSPVVRACLEAAHDDIAHLTGSDDEDGPADESADDGDE
jgi:hypothetical protein